MVDYTNLKLDEQQIHDDVHRWHDRQCDECEAAGWAEDRLWETMPEIVCLCGSTRFGSTFRDENFRLTLEGKIVLSIGCNMKSDAVYLGCMTDEQCDKVKECLDELHMRKIDLADEVRILNVGGYIGVSTANELGYARQRGKRITFLESQEEKP